MTRNRYTAVHLDGDGYPTEEAERLVREWPHDDFHGLMAFVRGLWRYSEYWNESKDFDIIGKEVIKHHVSTAGWSGNESLIQALKENRMFWLMCWEQSRRGGHYIFELRA
jgi:hypothetical protein